VWVPLCVVPFCVKRARYKRIRQTATMPSPPPLPSRTHLYERAVSLGQAIHSLVFARLVREPPGAEVTSEKRLQTSASVGGAAPGPWEAEVKGGRRQQLPRDTA
jgi:hypothetical protein